MTAPRPIPILDPRRGVLTYEGRPLHDPDESIVDQGLAFDVDTLLSRRSMLKAIGLGGMSAGLVTLAACSPSAGSSASTAASAGSTASTAPSAASTAGSAAAVADCSTVIPEETAGPFPGDGSNGPDVLTQSGVVRSDIRTSFGTSTTTAQGVPLTIRFALLDASEDCAPLADAAVYAWHCDRDGNYSMYSQGITNENYLRGVQATGADGVATFSSIFPACYQGRWPHIHFEVYRSLAEATSPTNRIATSQIALPADVCRQVYATDGYQSSLTTFPQVSLQTDMVFSDDAAIHQIGAMSGTIANGLTVELPVPVQTA